MKQRWMTAREKWGVMGWPVWPDVAVAMNVGMVDVKQYTHPHTLIGNTWHFACVGVLKLVQEKFRPKELRQGTRY